MLRQTDRQTDRQTEHTDIRRKSQIFVLMTDSLIDSNQDKYLQDEGTSSASGPAFSARMGEDFNTWKSYIQHYTEVYRHVLFRIK